MTTPLFWKSCDIYVRFYNKALGHTLLVWLDAEKEEFVTYKNTRTSITVGVFLCSLLGFFLLAIDVLYEVSIAKTYLLPTSLVLTNIIVILVIVLTVVVTTAALPCIEIITKQYFNSVLMFEKQLLKHKSYDVISVSLPCLLFAGKHLSYVFLMPNMLTSNYFLSFYSQSSRNFLHRNKMIKLVFSF